MASQLQSMVEGGDSFGVFTVILPLIFILLSILPFILLIYVVYKGFKIGFKTVLKKWYFWLMVILLILRFFPLRF